LVSLLLLFLGIPTQGEGHTPGKSLKRIESPRGKISAGKFQASGWKKTQTYKRQIEKAGSAVRRISDFQSQ